MPERRRTAKKILTEKKNLEQYTQINKNLNEAYQLDFRETKEMFEQKKITLNQYVKELDYHDSRHCYKPKTGKISKNTAKRIKEIVETWTNAVEENKILAQKEYKAKTHPYLTFCTLTLPHRQIHTDEELKNTCLKGFIYNLRRKGILINYLWKAEAQKNGNLHFHIVFDRWIDWQAIRKEWNNQLNKLGYINAYQQKMQNIYKNGFVYLQNSKMSRQQQFEAYKKGKAINWSDPNTTDIHKLKSIKNTVNYICKYLTKCQIDDGYRRVTGRIWGCNDELRKFKPLVVPAELFGNDFQFLTSQLRAIAIDGVECVSLYCGKVQELISTYCEELYIEKFKHFRNLLRDSWTRAVNKNAALQMPTP